jgi:NitT/TauT family transport system substrate-binding protein
MRRYTQSLLVCAFLWSCYAHSSNDPEKNSLTKLDVCLSSDNVTHIGVLYAADTGIFEKHGLQVTVTPINSGSGAVAALVSGSAQICQISGPAVVHAAVAGADVVIIGGLINKNLYALMVPEQIRSAADLKGKAVAVSAAGSSSETSMLMALRLLRLTPYKDVAILSIGDRGERLAAMEAGYVVGTLIAPPETILARDRGYHVLLDLSTSDLPYQHTATITSRTFIQNHRSTVLKFMEATAESLSVIKQNKEAAFATISRHLQLDPRKDVAILDETYDVMITRNFAYPPYPSLPGIQALLNEVALADPAASQFKPEQLVDLSIVEELKKAGSFRELGRRE